MKRAPRITRHLFTVGLLAAATLSSPGVAAAQDALSDIKKRGEITVGTEFQFAPFEFLQGDKPVGFDVDLFDLRRLRTHGQDHRVRLPAARASPPVCRV